MTNKEIEHMWKAASNDPHHDFNWFDPVVVKFANLVAEKEREACANICETLELLEWPDKVRQPLAKAIRARGQE